MVKQVIEPRSPVNEKKVKEHIKFAIVKNWIGKVYGFEGWFKIQVEEKPLVIHDLNGQVLFYEYQINLDNQVVGVAKGSASKLIGSPVPQIQLGPRRWDPNDAVLKAKESVKKLYPNAKISKTEFVCYSYPKIGVRVDLSDSKGDARSLIFDVASTNLVDRFGADELPGFTSYSFYDEIIEHDATKREALWDATDKNLEAVKRAIPRIFGPKMDPRERKTIEEAYVKLSIYPVAISLFSQKIIQYCPHCSTHNCNALHSQHTDVYCACATGQMILDFYRFYYNQDECAAAMGTGPYGTYISSMVDGLESLSKYCLDAVLDGSADWSEAKSEIDANRPLASLVPGHARACFGWKRQNIYLLGATPARWLYILDPWPWNSDICLGGAVYWEDWSAVNHTYFIYVRHRSTNCT
jgi:hypothetical protein